MYCKQRWMLNVITVTAKLEVDNTRQSSDCHGVSEKSAKFRFWDKVPAV